MGIEVDLREIKRVKGKEKRSGEGGRSAEKKAEVNFWIIKERKGGWDKEKGKKEKLMAREEKKMS